MSSSTKKNSPKNAPSLRLGITGVSGFIGSRLVELATAAGHQIIGFSRRPEREVPGVPEMREFSRPDQADYRDLDVIVHLAGEPVFGLWTQEKKRLIEQTRVEGTRDLVRGVEKLRVAERPRALICASAIGYYGDAGDDLADEDSDPGFGFLAEVVRGWETAAREASDIGLRSASVRVGFVLGETGGALPLLRKIFRACLGGRLGSGEQWMSWVHVDDVARAFLECCENDSLKGPVNAVSPHPVTNREFTRTLARLLQRPAVLPAPAFALKLAPGGMGELFLHSQRVDPGVLRLGGFSWTFPYLEDALRAGLGMADGGAGE